MFRAAEGRELPLQFENFGAHDVGAMPNDLADGGLDLVHDARALRREVDEGHHGRRHSAKLLGAGEPGWRACAGQRLGTGTWKSGWRASRSAAYTPRIASRH